MVSLIGRRTKRTFIGLDIGEHGVRAVQLTRTGDKYTVSNVALSERQFGERGEGEGAIEPNDRLQTLVQDAGCAGRRVVVGLNAPAVEYYPLDLPEAVLVDKNANVTDVVRWEVGRLMSAPVDDFDGEWAEGFSLPQR